MEQFPINASAVEKYLYKASFFRRFFAQLVDVIFYIIYLYLVNFVFESLFWLMSRLFTYNLHKVNPQSAYVIFISTSIIGFFIFFVIPGFFYLRYIQNTGTTLGKKLLKLKIAPISNSLHFKQIFLREIILKPISLLYFGLGFFWVIWDKDGQAWHDKIVKTFVVTTVSSKVGSKWSYIFMIGILTLLLGIVFAYGYLSSAEVRYWNRVWLKESDYDRLLMVQDALYSIEKINIDGTLLCNGIHGYCEGSDKDNLIYSTRQYIDGRGWIKVNFKQLGYEYLDYLPTGNYKSYKYCSDGKSWEISVSYDDNKGTYLTRSDGGNNSNDLEFGSNKSLCK